MTWILWYLAACFLLILVEPHARVRAWKRSRRAVDPGLAEHQERLAAIRQVTGR